MITTTVSPVMAHKTYYNFKLIGVKNGLVSEEVAAQILLDLLRVHPKAYDLIKEWKEELKVQDEKDRIARQEAYDAQERRANSPA